MFLDDEFAEILETLSRYHSGLTLNEICSKTGLSKRTILKHLKLLVNMNLIKVKRQENEQYTNHAYEILKAFLRALFFTYFSELFRDISSLLVLRLELKQQTFSRENF